MIQEGGRDGRSREYCRFISNDLDTIGVPRSYLPTDQFTFDSVSLIPYLTDPKASPQRDWMYTNNSDLEGI